MTILPIALLFLLQGCTKQITPIASEEPAPTVSESASTEISTTTTPSNATCTYSNTPFDAGQTFPCKGEGKNDCNACTCTCNADGTLSRSICTLKLCEQPKPEAFSCTYDNRVYQVGANFKCRGAGKNSCNTCGCTCTAEGRVKRTRCTKMMCRDSGGEVKKGAAY